MRAAISLVLSLSATACVSSSIEVVSEADAGAPVDAGSPDAGRDSGSDAGRDSGAPDAGGECRGPSDCILIAECCPGCGPQYGDVRSVPRAGADPARPVGCNTVSCDFCEELVPEPLLVPDCVNNVCAILDLAEQSELNECGLAAEGDDCLLRASACCECEVAPYYDTLVSIAQSQEGDYLDRVCGGMDCPPCPELPNYPDEGYFATCEPVDDSDRGRCTFYGPED